MLPDYPKVKNRLRELLRERIIDAQDARLGVFSRIPHTMMHEGERHVLKREDGTVVEQEPKRVEATAELQLDLREIDSWTSDDLQKTISSLGEGLAEGKMKQWIEVINEAVTQVGNVTDPSKSILEQFFEATEKRLMEFNDDGTIAPCDIMVGSEKAVERMKAIMEEIHSTPELWQRYEAIIQKKREEWRDREAARNLVE